MGPTISTSSHSDNKRYLQALSPHGERERRERERGGREREREREREMEKDREKERAIDR